MRASAISAGALGDFVDTTRRRRSVQARRVKGHVMVQFDATTLVRAMDIS